MRFLNLAKEVANWSKDPSTKVGAVIADKDHRIVSIGFNGFPQGIKDDERLNDREKKYELTIHAEANAILFAGRSLDGCTCYTWPLPCCSRCAAIIIQSGMDRFVSLEVTEPRWIESCKLGQDLLKEAGVQTFLVEKLDA
jgi:dCMP deaminase